MCIAASATVMGYHIQVSCPLGSIDCTDEMSFGKWKLKNFTYLYELIFRSFNTKLDSALYINFYLRIWIFKLLPWGKHVLNKEIRMAFCKITHGQSHCGVLGVLAAFSFQEIALTIRLQIMISSNCVKIISIT